MHAIAEGIRNSKIYSSEGCSIDTQDRNWLLKAVYHSNTRAKGRTSPINRLVWLALSLFDDDTVGKMNIMLEKDRKTWHLVFIVKDKVQEVT